MEYTNRNSSGFSVIDLLVSISIATMILSISLFSYRSFSNRLAVSAATQEIQTITRQAQTYSLSVKEVSMGGGDFSKGYGVYFSTDDSHSYYIFADKNANKIYDGDALCSVGSECVEKGQLRNNVSIVRLCGTDGGNVTSCPPLAAKAVSIVFPPSNFQNGIQDASITFTDSSNQILSGSYDIVQVVGAIQDVEDVLGSVSVNKVGQISSGILLTPPTNNHPPVVVLSGSNPLAVTTGSTYTDPGATASDEEDGNLTSSITTNGTVNTLIPGTYTVNYSVTDSLGAVPSPAVTRTVVVGAPSCTIANASIVGTIATGDSPYALQIASAVTVTESGSVSSTYVYVVNRGDSTLQVINVSDPSSPVTVKTIGTGSSPNSIVRSGDYLYITNRFSNNIQVFSIFDRSNPILVNTIPVSVDVFGAEVSGNYLYVLSNTDSTLKIYSLADKTTPVLTGSVVIPSSAGSLTSVAVSGNYAYVTLYLDHVLQVVDISNPATPSLGVAVAIGTTDNYPTSVSISGGYAHVTDFGNGYHVFTLTDPSNPVQVYGSSLSGYQPQSIKIKNTHSYIVNRGENSLQVFNISTPSNPTSIGKIYTDSLPWAVLVSGVYGYVANYSGNTLQIVNLGCLAD